MSEPSPQLGGVRLEHQPLALLGQRHRSRHRHQPPHAELTVVRVARQGPRGREPEAVALSPIDVDAHQVQLVVHGVGDRRRAGDDGTAARSRSPVPRPRRANVHGRAMMPAANADGGTLTAGPTVLPDGDGAATPEPRVVRGRVSCVEASPPRRRPSRTGSPSGTSSSTTNRRRRSAIWTSRCCRRTISASEVGSRPSRTAGTGTAVGELGLGRRRTDVAVARRSPAQPAGWAGRRARACHARSGMAQHAELGRPGRARRRRGACPARPAGRRRRRRRRRSSRTSMPYAAVQARVHQGVLGRDRPEVWVGQHGASSCRRRRHRADSRPSTAGDEPWMTGYEPEAADPLVAADGRARVRDDDHAGDHVDVDGRPAGPAAGGSRQRPRPGRRSGCARAGCGEPASAREARPVDGRPGRRMRSSDWSAGSTPGGSAIRRPLAAAYLRTIAPTSNSSRIDSVAPHVPSSAALIRSRADGWSSCEQRRRRRRPTDRTSPVAARPARRTRGRRPARRTR